MIKKIICLGIILIMCLGLFYGCNRKKAINAYKIESKTTIETYAQERQDNFAVDNWTTVCGIVAVGKAAIDAADSKDEIVSAVSEARAAIDKVPPIEITVDDFIFSVYTDKVDYLIGEKVIVTVKLKNLSDKDILCEVPNWIAAYGGQQIKDVLLCNFIPNDSDFDWTVNSIAVEPRPRVTLEKGAEIESTFEYTISELNNFEVRAGAFFFIGYANDSRFNQQISLVNNPIKITVWAKYESEMPTVQSIEINE